MDSMDTSNLDDLLHRAEQLTASIDGNLEMPRIERNLKQLLDASDQMSARTTSGFASKEVIDVRASVLLGSKGFDLQKVTQQLDSLNAIKKTAASVQVEAAAADSDIKGFLKKEYEDAIMKNIETVRTSTIEASDAFYLNFIQKEWEDQKTRILNALVGPDEIKEMSFDIALKSPNNTTTASQASPAGGGLAQHQSGRTKLYFDRTFIDKTAISSMNASEMAFAKEVVKYVDQVVNTSLKSDITRSFATVARNIIGESSVIDLWHMVSLLINSSIPQISEADPLSRRNSLKLNSYFIGQACAYLEEKFVQSMQGMVNSPIGQVVNADVVYSLVRDYLHIKTPYYSNAAGSTSAVSPLHHHSHQPQQQQLMHSSSFSGLQSHSASFSFGGPSPSKSINSSGGGCEDGAVEGIPLWCFLFYCLRAGSIDAAISVVQKMQQPGGGGGQLKAELTNILREYKLSNDGQLSRKTEETLKLHYQRTVRLSGDVYKKSVYAIFARCAHEDFHPEVFDKVDDFLWIKLKKVSFASSSSEIDGPSSSISHSHSSSADVSRSSSSLSTSHLHHQQQQHHQQHQQHQQQQHSLNLPDQFSLSKFKREILEELGESYFEAAEQPFLYFRALFLTLQWEAAVEFLFRFDAYRCYALHIALALHEHRLLIPSAHVKLSILSRVASDPVETQRLNLAKLISLYTKKFEATNTVDVVYYYYFLHDLRTPSGESLFAGYVSALVRETKAYDALLGYVNGADGVRVPGAIDKFNQFDAALIITQVAIDLENDGHFEEAVKLYDLAGSHGKVLSLLNKMLCPLVAHHKGVDTKREKIEAFAIQIAERYCNQKCKASREVTSTFYLLIDLMTFFDLYHNRQYNEALDTIIKLNIFPLRAAEIDGKVNDFAHYSDEVRRNIPDLLLATMDILCSQYKEVKSSIPKVINKFGFIGDASNKEQLCSELREKARSLITFAGMVPYRMPGDANAKLIQLESSMA